MSKNVVCHPSHTLVWWTMYDERCTTIFLYNSGNFLFQIAQAAIIASFKNELQVFLVVIRLGLNN